jgi:hypothetical protein
MTLVVTFRTSAIEAARDAANLNAPRRESFASASTEPLTFEDYREWSFFCSTSFRPVLITMKNSLADQARSPRGYSNEASISPRSRT